MLRKQSIIVAFALYAILGIFGVQNYMESSIKPLPEKWDTLFKGTPEVITQYAAENPIHLRNYRIVGQDLSDSTIPNATFENIEWSDFVAIDSKFVNTRFVGGSVENSGFSRSTLTHVTFENMVFYNVEFIAATLIDVTFKNCKIYNSKIHSLHNSKVTIEDSELAKVDFFDSELDITLKNTRVIELGKFSGLKPGSRVYLEDSYIGPYSSFKYSHIVSFKAVRSELEGFALGDSTGQADFISSKLDFNLGHGYFGKLNVQDCEIKLMSSSKGAVFDKISINDCRKSNEVFFIHANINDLNVRNCDLVRFGPINSNVVKANIANSSFVQTDADDVLFKELVLHNVNFTGETVFKGAQADDTELFKVTFAPGATLDATGSNIPFNR